MSVLRALGWKVMVCDPLRQAAEGGDYVELDTLLQACDVISLHTPLERGGQYPTWHLFGPAELAKLRPGAWLINASRGAVVDNGALRALLQQRDDLHAVLDVWEGEPQVDLQLADLCTVATPHIAGYSLDGRQRGTAQIYRALCQHLGVNEVIQLADLLPRPPVAQIELDAEVDLQWALAMLCRAVYDPRRDDADFRRSLSEDVQHQRAAFDALRKHYPPRREIEGLSVRIRGSSPELARLIDALGAKRV